MASNVAVVELFVSGGADVNARDKVSLIVMICISDLFVISASEKFL